MALSFNLVNQAKALKTRLSVESTKAIKICVHSKQNCIFETYQFPLNYNKWYLKCWESEIEKSKYA